MKHPMRKIETLFNPLTLGAQLYTVRELTKTREDFTACMKAISEIGYTTVQLSAVGINDIPFIKQTLDECGLRAVLTHIPPDRLLHDLDAVLQEHEILGADIVGLGMMPREYRDTAEGIDRFLDDFTPVCDKITSSGLRFAYHNHFFEFGKYKDRLIIDRMLERLRPHGMGIIFDTYWAQYGGCDPAEWIAGHTEDIYAVHLKDMQIKDGAQAIADVLDGNMNFDGIIHQCRKLNADLFVEHDNPENPIESLRTSYNNLIERYGNIG